MQLAQYHSHFNGYEHIQVHRPELWDEIADVIGSVDAAVCKSKQDEDANRVRYSASKISERFQTILKERGWVPSRLENLSTKGETDFIKDRIQIEVQFGKYAFVAFDMFVKHMAFFVSDKMDVGIEILPMKSLQDEMSSGVAYYERGLYDLLRQGRSTPAVPLIVIGVAP